MRIEQNMVCEFHQKFGLPTGPNQENPAPRPEVTRLRLIIEEVSELAAAYDRADPVEVADALGDLLYVILGTAVIHGYDMEKIFHEIHRSNMTKDGDLDGGKITKGRSFDPPNLESIVRGLY